jgi:hypothetical protein
MEPGKGQLGLGLHPGGAQHPGLGRRDRIGRRVQQHRLASARLTTEQQCRVIGRPIKECADQRALTATSEQNSRFFKSFQRGQPISEAGPPVYEGTPTAPAARYLGVPDRQPRPRADGPRTLRPAPRPPVEPPFIIHQADPRPFPGRLRQQPRTARPTRLKRQDGFQANPGDGSLAISASGCAGKSPRASSPGTIPVPGKCAVKRKRSRPRPPERERSQVRACMRQATGRRCRCCGSRSLRGACRGPRSHGSS